MLVRVHLKLYDGPSLNRFRQRPELVPTDKDAVPPGRVSEPTILAGGRSVEVHIMQRVEALNECLKRTEDGFPECFFTSAILPFADDIVDTHNVTKNVFFCEVVLRDCSPPWCRILHENSLLDGEFFRLRKGGHLPIRESSISTRRDAHADLTVRRRGGPADASCCRLRAGRGGKACLLLSGPLPTSGSTRV